MTESDTLYLDQFPTWLGSLGTDAEAMSTVLSLADSSEGSKQSVAGGLNYLFKSIDLIPDGMDDIGYLDDAFVLRVAADRMGEIQGLEEAQVEVIDRLKGDCDTIQTFLADNYGRLVKYVDGLKNGAARGRSVPDIVSDKKIQADFLADVRGFAKSYHAPSFAREERNLIKLKAFFDAKLPR